MPRIIEEPRMEAMHAKPISVPLDNDSFHVVVEDLDRHAPEPQEHVLGSDRVSNQSSSIIRICDGSPQRRNEKRQLVGATTNRGPIRCSVSGRSRRDAGSPPLRLNPRANSSRAAPAFVARTVISRNTDAECVGSAAFIRSTM